MNANYNMILIAGSRINGAPLYGSDAERFHAERDMESLLLELGDRVITIHDNLGFLTVTLTDEELIRYSHDIRVYSIERERLVAPLLFDERSVSLEHNWALRLLSHNRFKPDKLLCGFKLELVDRVLGHGSDIVTVHTEIKLTSEINKLIYKLQLYNYEPVALGPVVSIGVDCDFDLDTDVYIVYCVENEYFELVKEIAEGQFPLYTVKIKRNSVTAVTNGVVYGFYDLKLTDDNAMTYRYSANGEGVIAIVGDTQLSNRHPGEFGTRLRKVYNAYAADYITRYGSWDSDSPDISSHGTSVASVIGGNTCGIASAVELHGVTCLDVSTSQGNKSVKTVEAFNWIIGYIERLRAERAPAPVPIVCNFSIGGEGVSEAEDAAIAAMINDDVVVVIGAGNDNTDRAHSPWAQGALIVGATDENLVPASFSDFGHRISLWAPGKDVRVATNTGGYEVTFGTSFSAPYVTGLCAIYYSLHPGAKATDVVKNVLATAAAYVSYNKPDSTYLHAMHPDFYVIDAESVSTPALRPRRILSVVPFITGLDGERSYGELHELTFNQVTDATVSAGQLESKEIATAFKLNP